MDWRDIVPKILDIGGFLVEQWDFNHKLVQEIAIQYLTK